MWSIPESQFAKNETLAPGARLGRNHAAGKHRKATYPMKAAAVFEENAHGNGPADCTLTVADQSRDSRMIKTFLKEWPQDFVNLNNATERILDILEIGLCIAWSSTEHLHDHIGARCLFATH